MRSTPPRSGPIVDATGFSGLLGGAFDGMRPTATRNPTAIATKLAPIARTRADIVLLSCLTRNDRRTINTTANVDRSDGRGKPIKAQLVFRELPAPDVVAAIYKSMGVFSSPLPLRHQTNLS